MNNKIQLIILLILTLIQDYSAIENYRTRKKDPQHYDPNRMKSTGAVCIVLILLTILELVLLGMEGLN